MLIRRLLPVTILFVLALTGAPAQDIEFLVIDNDSIKAGEAPNFFTDQDVNTDVVDIGQRMQLRFFASHVTETITLRTGSLGDEAWFALPTIPASWVAAGPTADGVRNFFGDPRLPPSYNVGPGLGTPDSNGDREALLDNVPDVTPLQTAALQGLLGRRACAVVYDSDVSVNMGPTTGSLKGSNLGTVAFEVVSVTPQGGSQLPDVEIKIFDAEILCTDVTALTISAAIGPPANGAG